MARMGMNAARPVRVALAVMRLKEHARAWRGWRWRGWPWRCHEPEGHLSPEGAEGVVGLLLELQTRAEWAEGWREGVQLGADLQKAREECRQNGEKTGDS